MNKTILRGQRVRILQTDELGTVAEKVFMKRRGKERPSLYCRVWLDKKPDEDRWYWADQLGETREQAICTFRCGGQELTADVVLDHETDRLQFTLIGQPVNLKEHRGLHIRLLVDLLERLTDGGRNVLDSSLQTEP